MNFNRLKITQTKKENAKLSFVKALKDVTGFGLKQSKDLTDDMNAGFARTNSPFSIEINLDSRKPDIKTFISDLRSHCTGEYIVNGGTGWERDVKLLSIGLGSDDEYVSFISEYNDKTIKRNTEFYIRTTICYG